MLRNKDKTWLLHSTSSRVKKTLPSPSERLKEIIQKNDLAGVSDFIESFKYILSRDDHFLFRYTCTLGESHVPMIELMLLHGSDPNASDSEAIIDAASRGNYLVLQTLIKYKGDPTRQNFWAYYSAAYFGHLNILEFFINTFGKPTKNGVDFIIANLPENNVNLQKIKEMII